MFNLVKNSKLDQIRLNIKDKAQLFKTFQPKIPIKRAEFSSINKKEGIINSKVKNNDIKINYSIEDRRYFEGLLIVLTNIGTIFLYDIYSKKNKSY